MHRKILNKKLNNRFFSQIGLRKNALKAILILLLSSVNYSFATVNSDFHTTHSTLTENESCIKIFSNEVRAYSQHLLDSNFPNTIPEKQEDSNEEVQEDNTDDVWNINSYFSIHQSTSIISSCNCQLRQSLQNRSTVPYYILFHSWKSFLS